jgi:hypothetical protein
MLKACTDAAHGALDVPLAVWRDTLPSPTALSFIVLHAMYGNPPRKWFAPSEARGNWARTKYRLATELSVLGMKGAGARAPRPERVDRDDAVVIARWANEQVAAHGGCKIETGVSLALLVGLESLENGIDLTGVRFSVGGEPITIAKWQGITQTGAQVLPFYAMAEAGCVATACARPDGCDDMHFCRHSLAVLTSPSTAKPETGVETFHLTTLTPDAPKILLNVDSDDYGTMDARSCGCQLEDLGFADHVKDVQSISKLTGEAVTLIGTDAAHVLEKVLPALFGGSPLDYQLLEEEDERGTTRLYLVISPRVDIADEAEVVNAFLDGLGKGSLAGDIRAVWRTAGTMRLKRIEPIIGRRGKVLPLVRNRSVS